MKKISDFLRTTGSSLTRLLQSFKVLSVPRSMDELKSGEEPPPAKRVCLQVDEHATEATNERKDGPRFPKRRKTILLLSYSGKGYMGMQK